MRQGQIGMFAVLDLIELLANRVNDIQRGLDEARQQNVELRTEVARVSGKRELMAELNLLQQPADKKVP